MGGSFVFLLILFVILVAAYYVILKKTGYNPWLSLLILIPGLGGLIILCMLIFTEWPIQRELRELRSRAGGGYPPGGYAPGGSYPPGGLRPAAAIPRAAARSRPAAERSRPPPETPESRLEPAGGVVRR